VTVPTEPAVTFLPDGRAVPAGGGKTVLELSAATGDRLRTGGTVTGVRVEDGARAVDCEVWLDSGEVRVIAGDATLVFPPDEAA